VECCFVIPFLFVWSIMAWRWLTFFSSEAPATLDAWSRDGGFVVLNKQSRSLFKGPFFWDPRGVFQLVYRVSVQDYQGRSRMGWVRVWGYPWSYQPHLEARWDGDEI
jgi:hypothetical protein